MKTKLVLKKWVRVVLTLIVLAFSVYLYTQTDTLGKLAEESNFYKTLCLMAWGWITLGQLTIYSIIWE